MPPAVSSLPSNSIRPHRSATPHPRQCGQRHIGGARLDLLHGPGKEAPPFCQLLLRQFLTHPFAAHTGAETLQQGGLIA